MLSLNRLIEVIDKLITLVVTPIVVSLSFAVAFMLAWGVFSRSILDTPVFGLEELVLISAMWLYLMGAVLAAKDRSHLTADFVSVLFKNKKMIAGMSILATVISFVMALYFVSWSYELLAWSVKKSQITPVFKLPWYLSQSSLFVGSVALVFYLVRDFIKDFQKFINV
ncbi:MULTISPECIES: TRAP transporter small permease [Marinomonas]|jgi:TRAP-type transport system small permease protein|uniref:TRAP transporter small permease n=1 Tax=Marinomonas TaxID=28253 RepID=UPI002244B03D|nr:TRAP transporter small permease subunit [Marinomonas pontica]MCW8357064.1 TRAP transporter small permease subunit [Marinomonas pontica]